MIPHIIRELKTKEHFPTWAVLMTKEKKFFEITKALHNLIHDNGKHDEFTFEDKLIFERVCA